MNVLHAKLIAALAGCSLLAVAGGCSTTGAMRPLPFASPPPIQDPLATARTSRVASERTQALQQLKTASKKKSPQEQEQVASGLTSLLATEANPRIRRDICRTLSHYPTAASLDSLKNGLKDPDVAVRIACVQAVAERGGPEAEQSLAQVLADDSSIDVRIETARVLGGFKSEDAKVALGGALEDSDPALQRRAMHSLSQVTGKSFGNDVGAWRAYVQGGSPNPRTDSVAEKVRGWLYTF